ncbi:hypothetical protein HY640_01240 [Candidatus Woesearchaeota archaeon]|nr:hypothetical protein [Candidatus Woesearchaeota archaeon]
MNEAPAEAGVQIMGMPPNTGQKNPVIRAIHTEKGTYLWYDAISSYFSPAACTRFIRGQCFGNVEALEGFFDPITAKFAKGVISPMPQYGITEGYEWQKEMGARKGIVTRPYLVGLAAADVFGGVWQDDDLTSARRKGLKVAVFHISVDPTYRRFSFGTDMLSVYSGIMAKKNYDGIACLFDNDDEHVGTAEFFEKNGFEVTRYGLQNMYSQAVLMFPERSYYKPNPEITAAESNNSRSSYPCPVPR